MNKLAIIFIILIVLGVSVEAALLLKIFTFPKDFSFINLGPVTELKVDTQNIAPAGGKVISISLTKDGFNPKSITAGLGDKLIWTNNTTSPTTVNSDTHPIHDLYPFLNLGEFQPGQTVRIIMRQIGTFRYHNHLNPSQTGTITVK